MRHFWTLTHRYVGLVMTLFLVIAGLTGSLIVWYEELDRAVWPALREVAPPADGAAPLDVLLLRERVLASIPDASGDSVRLQSDTPGMPVRFGLKTPLSGEEKDTEVFVNPYTGAELGRRNWGDITQGSKNLMPFIYRLHYTLALGTIGTYAFGIVALLWTLDCFVGAYLTFPRGRPFLQKWKPAWSVKSKRLNYDLHRAGGLWPWAMLLVLAWSSVAFNLREVYTPVTKALFDYQDHFAELPKLDKPQREPGMDFRAAHQRAQALAAQEAARLGFVIKRENFLQYRPANGVFRYGMTSDRDIRESGGGTQLLFDANNGALVKTILPSGQHSGNTVTNWFLALHMAAVWGLPFRIFVCVIGIAVASLSVTGVIIWWRKRRARLSSAAKRGVLAASESAVDRARATQGQPDLSPTVFVPRSEG